MRRFLQFSLLTVICSSLLLVGLGCDSKQADEETVLKVGVVASLTGPASAWGEVTVRSAQVIADYYNELGGVELGGKRMKIELIVKDDQFDASETVRVVHELIAEGVQYVIGPVGDSTVLVASRVLDAAGVLYVHYGFDSGVYSSSSLGFVGMPLPEQSLPVLFKYLRDERAVERVLVLAYGTESGIRQKGVAEYIASDQGLDVLNLSRFDVSEETLGQGLSEDALNLRVDRVLSAYPDAVLLAGCPPEVFAMLVERLRAGGFSGLICAQNFQDPRLLATLGEASEDVYYVGGRSQGGARTHYYAVLKERYLNLTDDWSEDVETKFYAMEFIVACLRHAGPLALEDTSVLYKELNSFRFKDPFYLDPRWIPIAPAGQNGQMRQIQTPVRISKMHNGESILIAEQNAFLEP